jgi:hypothetical protein
MIQHAGALCRAQLPVNVPGEKMSYMTFWQHDLLASPIIRATGHPRTLYENLETGIVGAIHELLLPTVGNIPSL